MRTKLVFCFIAAVVSAPGAVLYSNLAGTSGGLLNVGDTSSNNTDWANEFTTGASSVTLTDLIVIIGRSSGGGAITASLYASSGGGAAVPTTKITDIATVNHSSVPASPAQVTFTPGATITLTANTQYWIVLSGASGAGHVDALWSETNDNSGTGVSGQSHAFWNGSTWTNEPNATFLATPQMQIDAGTAAATPEPGSMLLIGFGLVLASAFRKFSR